MLESLRNAVERFTPVRAHLRVGIHAVHGVFIRWVANELYVVVSRSFMARFLAPARPTIFRCVSTVPFNGRVQLVWIRWSNIHPDTAHISARQSAAKLFPIRPTVRALVNRTFWPTAEVGVHVATT